MPEDRPEGRVLGPRAQRPGWGRGHLGVGWLSPGGGREEAGRDGGPGWGGWGWGRGPAGGPWGGRDARTVGLPLQVVLLHAVDGELVRRVGGGQRRRHEQQHGGQEDDEAERQARRLQHVFQHLACFLQHPGRRQSRTGRQQGREGGGGGGGGSRGLTSAWVTGGVLRALRRAPHIRCRVLRALLRTAPARRAASWDM